MVQLCQRELHHLSYITCFLSNRWRGDYGGKKHEWFPSNYVEEIEPQDSSPLGSMQKGTIDLAGCSLDRIMGGRGDRQFVFRIWGHGQRDPLEIAADSDQELIDWMHFIRECANNEEAKVRIGDFFLTWLDMYGLSSITLDFYVLVV